MSYVNVTYENVRDFAASFGFFILAATYAVAVLWTFRRRAHAAHRRAALIIFVGEDKPSANRPSANSPSAKESDHGR